jgi:hypothetical protein
MSMRRLVSEAFPGGEIEIQVFGNVLAATSFLHGLAAEELRPDELDFRDANFEVTIAVRARRAPADAPDSPERAAPGGAGARGPGAESE